MNRLLGSLVLGFALCVMIGDIAHGQPVYHDAQLNWDFKNFTGQTANDFEIIVSNPNYNPDTNDSSEVYTGGLGFPNANVTHGDLDPANPGNETKIRWSGRNFPDGAVAHVGLDLNGAGNVLGASWTFDNQFLAWKVPITFERTRATPSNPFDINMELNIAPTFFTDSGNPAFPNQQAGWTNIRTFIDIPENVLGLVDINTDLDLATLAAFETAPRVGGPAGALINLPDVFLFSDDSIFDVFVGSTNSANPQFESLLVADVLDQGQEVIGRFWNLNRQSPEPNTLVLLGLGVLFVTRRRTK